MAMSRFVVVDRDAMPVKAWRSLLSGRERAEVSTFSARRRDRTVTSRILAKFLTVSEGGPAYRELLADHIAAVPHDQLAAVESLSGPARDRRGAMVSRAGKPVPNHAVSSAHCGKYTAVGQSGGRLGVDLERIELRRPEFYRQMFSAEERAWVDALHESRGATVEAAYTLLWSVKEAFLKASGLPKITVWNFAHWTVRVGEDVASILQPMSVAAPVQVTGRIESAGTTYVFEVSARRVGDMLLVTVQYEVTDEAGRVSL
jgi:phosphopantetheinyl transferase (holo-ACP synthase)